MGEKKAGTGENVDAARRKRRNSVGRGIQGKVSSLHKYLQDRDCVVGPWPGRNCPEASQGREHWQLRGRRGEIKVG